MKELSMRRFETTYKVKTRDNIGSSAYWNVRLEDIDVRFHLLETNYGDLEKIGESITALGLERLDNGLTPIIQEAGERLRSVNNLFSATSATTLAIGTGNKVLVLEEGSRDTFVPGAFVHASQVGNPNKFIYGNVLDYDGETGSLTLDVTLTMGVGSVNEWLVVAAGPRGPQGSVGVAEGAASEVGVDPIAGLAATDAQAAFAELVGIAAALNSALTGKANSAHAHAMGDVSGLSTALSAKASTSDVSALSASVTSALAAKAPIASPSFTGTMTVDGNVKLATGAATQTVTANTNNLSHPQHNAATILAVSPNGDWNLTGLVAPSTGASTIKLLVNDGVGTLVLTHNDANSSAANRFSTPSALPFELKPGQSVLVHYHASAWRIAAPGAAASSGTWTELIATSAVSTSLDSTVNDDPVLQFPVDANGIYAVDMAVHFSFGAQGVKFALNGPASPVHVNFNGSGPVRTTFTTETPDINYMTPFGYATLGTEKLLAWSAGLPTTASVVMNGVFENGPNAGTFAFRWAQIAASATATVRRPGSWLRYRKVA
jgi:hypothetical protein